MLQRYFIAVLVAAFVAGCSLIEGARSPERVDMPMKRIAAGTVTLPNGNTMEVEEPFYIGVYEVTQEQWRRVMGELPKSPRQRFMEDLQEWPLQEGMDDLPKPPLQDESTGDASSQFHPDLPVLYVNYRQAWEFCARLSEINGVTYRLPTTEEWLLACRAGTNADSWAYWQDEFDPAYCWYAENSDDEPHPVGTRKPNPWGLHDMLGNALELANSGAARHPDTMGGSFTSPRIEPGPLASSYGTIEHLVTQQEFGFRVAADAPLKDFDKDTYWSSEPGMPPSPSRLRELNKQGLPSSEDEWQRWDQRNKELLREMIDKVRGNGKEEE